jgi:hypothetical protein
VGSGNPIRIFECRARPIRAGPFIKLLAVALGYRASPLASDLAFMLETRRPGGVAPKAIDAQVTFELAIASEGPAVAAIWYQWGQDQRGERLP